MAEKFTDITRMTKIDLNQQAKVLSGPILLSLDVTNKCNLKCLHCFNRSGTRYARDELTDDEILQVVRQIRDVRPMVICFCGGEPMMRGKVIYRMFEIVADGQVRVNMVSNGYYISKEVARALKTAGANFIQISIDGINPASHDRLRGVAGSFARAMRAVENLTEQGVRVGVAFVPTKFNVYEFPEYVDSMRKMGVTEVHIQPIMPLGECMNHVDELLPSEEEYRWIVEVINNVPNQQSAEFSVEWGDPIEHFVRFGEAQREVNLYADLCSDGFLRVSPYLPLHVGQLRKHTLKEYWEAGYRAIWGYNLVRELSSKIRSVRDLMRITPSPYFEKFMYVDLIENQPGLNGSLSKELALKGGNNGTRNHSNV